MTKQTKKKVLKGSPESAFKLSRELMNTFMKSELFKNGKDNTLFPFDAMLAIAEFTSLVLKIMGASSPMGKVLKDSYMEDILPHMLNTSSEIDVRIKEAVDMIKAQPDLN